MLWHVLMVLGGAIFGMLVDQRPFGDAILRHPLVIFFFLVALGLLALRVLLAQPVPNVISDRALVGGCVLGLAAFLVGNYFGVYLMFRLHWASVCVQLTKCFP